MTEWTVALDFQHELTEARVDALIEALKSYSIVVGGHDGFPTSDVILSLDAPTAAAAFEEAWRLVTSIEPITPEQLIRLEVQRQVDMEREMERGNCS